MCVCVKERDRQNRNKEMESARQKKHTETQTHIQDHTYAHAKRVMNMMWYICRGYDHVTTFKGQFSSSYVSGSYWIFRINDIATRELSFWYLITSN